MSFNSETVAAFGKIIFVPTKESVPPLPIMSLLFLKDEGKGKILSWRAACIDLEIDACGNSQNEAWENLKASLTMYINMEISSADGSIIEAAKKITKAAFCESEQKRYYFKLYRDAKMEFTINSLESAQFYDPIAREMQQLEKIESEQDPIRSIVNELKAA